jgi:hypothetical protein
MGEADCPTSSLFESPFFSTGRLRAGSLFSNGCATLAKKIVERSDGT